MIQYRKERQGGECLSGTPTRYGTVRKREGRTPAPGLADGDDGNDGDNIEEQAAGDSNCGYDAKEITSLVLGISATSCMRFWGHCLFKSDQRG